MTTKKTIKTINKTTKTKIQTDKKEKNPWKSNSIKNPSIMTS
jgi:hypothetical protein